MAFAYTKLMQAMVAAGVVTDPYFNLVTLLLPGNGTNGAQNNTFLDSSTNNFTITRNGNTTQGTFSPFSQTGWSNYLASSGRLLFSINSAFDITQGDFTVEAWVNISSYSADQHIAWYRNDDPQSGWGFRINATTGYLLFFYTGGSTVTSTSAVPLNSWAHVAACRSGGTCYLFINGTQVGSAAFSNGTTQTSFGFRIGADSGGTGNLIGYISNFRLVKSGALYTSSFTPSTTPLTATVSAGTVSLLTCQSNRFVDNSSNAFAITLEGTTTSVQAFSPFAPTAAYSAATNGGSGYFDGTGDYLNVGAAADWVFLSNTTAAWTIECWVYNTTSGSTNVLFSTNNGTSASIGTNVFKTSSETIQVSITRGVSGSLVLNLTTTGTLVKNAWNHLFISYDQALASNNCLVYINGASAGTGSKTANAPSSSNPASALRIGTDDGSANFTTGYISSVRVSNTVRSVPSGVPTSPYTSDANTKLLANYTNAGITDATAKNDLETVGNASISTTQSKFGGSSIYLDGVGDYCALRSNQDLILGSGDFTIECWLYPLSQPGAFNAIIGGNATNQPLLNIRGSGTSTSIGFNIFGSADIFNINYTFTQNTWVHIAVSRSGTNLRLFINGTQTGSTVTNSTNIAAAITSVGMADNGNQYLNGYIDDLRITIGYARYTSAFTPPTAAFPLS